MTAPDISLEAVAKLAFKAEIDAGYGHYCGPSVVGDTLRALRAALTEAEAVLAAIAMVPDNCTSTALSFDPGTMWVNRDGSGCITISEKEFILEDDRDTEGGSVHWVLRLDASEVCALRNFLNGNLRQVENAAVAAAVERAAETASDWLEHDSWWSLENIIRATIEPSGRTALDAALAEAREKALREAASALDDLPPSNIGSRSSGPFESCYSTYAFISHKDAKAAILALIPKGGA